MIRILPYSEANISKIFGRVAPKTDVTGIVQHIISEVIRGGDAALIEYTQRFDRANLRTLEVTREELDEAVSAVDPAFIRVLEKAAANIRKFHQGQLRTSYIINDSDGVVMGQKVIPMDRVGIYVPGGTAPLSSTVLMDCIPAKIAGCREVIMATPPRKDGTVDPTILTAAKIAGVDRVFKVGGAQAVAALAYGTETVPKVDKIVGPGNAFVAEAKRQVFGQVAIDMIAGPSDILVVADGTANPAYVAADMLSQAEHDKLATAVLVTDSMELAQAVQAQIEEQLQSLPRQEIARASIENTGKIIVAETLDAAIEIANKIGPEHLELCVDNPFDYLDQIRHAGSIFMGKYCPEALGDYMAGPNHTLPTGGTARFSSPLSVDDFVKKSQYTYYTPTALRGVAKDVAYFAETEGLSAHARSALIRLEEDK